MLEYGRLLIGKLNLFCIDNILFMYRVFFEVWKIFLGINDNIMKIVLKVWWVVIELVVIGIYFIFVCFRKCCEFFGIIIELMKVRNNIICFDLFLFVVGFF